MPVDATTDRVDTASNDETPSADLAPPPALYSLADAAASRVATPTLRPAASSAEQVTLTVPPAKGSTSSTTAVPMGLGVGLSKHASPAGPQTPSTQRRAALLGKVGAQGKRGFMLPATGRAISGLPG
jgi:hypothetical protein